MLVLGWLERITGVIHEVLWSCIRMATVKFLSHGEIRSNCLTSLAWVPNVAKRLPMLVLNCQTVGSCLLCKIVI